MDFLTARLGKRRVGPSRELLVQLIDSSLTHILDTERLSAGRIERCDLLLDLRLAATEVVDLEAAVADGTRSSAAVTTEWMDNGRSQPTGHDPAPTVTRGRR